MRTVPTVPSIYGDVYKTSSEIRKPVHFNEASAYCPSYTEMCAKLPLQLGQLYFQGEHLGCPRPITGVYEAYRITRFGHYMSYCAEL